MHLGRGRAVTYALPLDYLRRRLQGDSSTPRPRDQPRAAATAAAVTTLVNWEGLQKEYGMKPFIAVYALRTPDREMPGTDHDAPVQWSTPSRVWHTGG